MTGEREVDGALACDAPEQAVEARADVARESGENEALTCDFVYGFIGCGTMGSALVRALVKRVDTSRVMVANRTAAKAQALAAELGVRAAGVAEVAREANVLVLGVKPQNLAALFAEAAPALSAREAAPVVVSMAAGKTIADIRALVAGASGAGAAVAGAAAPATPPTAVPTAASATPATPATQPAAAPIPVVRIMPNLPVGVGEGMTLICAEGVAPALLARFEQDFAASGQFCSLPEEHFDAGMAISGCGPAFAFMFADALAQGGVAVGLDPHVALTLAQQTMRGSAVLMQASSQTPAELTDAVCSPGGTTIEGVRVLQAATFAETLAAAVKASHHKAAALRA